MQKNGLPIRKLSTPHNSANSGFEELVDFNVSKIAEFAKSNEPILDEPITLEEICKVSTKLKTGKAAGNDSISNEMIKSSVSIIGPVLQINWGNMAEFKTLLKRMVGGLYFTRL